jgi:hypothetical protein
MRRRIPIALITATLLAALTVQASDFWIAKKWNQWSKDDCERLLADSPWAHTWRGGGPDGTQLAYAVQFRSALPLREALVRQIQFDQKYDKMTDAQRTAFDAQATQMLNRNYDDVILIHVDFSKATVASFLQGNLNSNRLDVDTWTTSLVTEDGTRIAPIRFDTKRNYTFDVIFPRMKNGVPLIKDVERHLSFQFQSPLLTGVAVVGNTDPTVAGRRIGVEFDVTKMVVEGKPSY